MAAELVVRMLGPVRVLTGDGSEVALRGNAARLTAWLALHPGRAWSVTDLADRLWPAGPPPTARTAIQGHVSKLRRRLGPDGPVRIETAADGYLLRIVPGGEGGASAEGTGHAGGDGACRSPVDVHRFTGLCERAAAKRTAGSERAAVRLLDEALALWAGDALAELRNDDPVLAARAAVLDDGRRDAEDALADALVAGRETDRALPLLGRLVDDDPLRERRWALLMTALTQAGRQTDALRAYRRAAAILVERTGLDPGPELRRLETAILLQDPSLDAARWQPATASAPSPVTGVVGRDTERAEVVSRLADARVVTLTGPGGVGKSTLAIDVAAAAAGTFDDGAVVVDLGPSGPGDVGLAIAAAVGAPVLPDGGAAAPGEDADDGADSGDPLARAATVLVRREVLVVLDGCEHVREQAARAAMVLAQASPGLRVLATSQVPLGVAGEVVVALAPLAIPSPGAAETAIRRSAAVELLARRLDDMGSPAQAGAEWQAVADIVRAVDGLPLAIELVAASARTEPLAELARRVSADVSTVLGADPPVGAGRLTLGATLDAAVDRLDDGATRLYELSSVFPGSFDATAAAALLDGDEPAARAALAVLADASLLVLDRPGRRRARLLQPVRAHAAGRIDDATRRTALERLTRWSLDLAAELDRTLHSPRQAEVIERFVVELPTFRAVLRRLIDEGDVVRAARLFEDLATCWGDSPASIEAQLWADELLPLADRLPPGPRAHLEVAIVHCQYAFELMAAKLDLAERALVRAEQAGDRFAAAAAQMQVAIALGWRNTDLERAEALLDAARAVMTEIGHAHWAAVALEFRGLVALRRLDIAGGIATLEAAVPEHRTSGGAGDVAHALMFIGFARRAVGDQPGARRAFEEARRVLGDVRVATWLRATVGAAHASLAMGDTEAAAETFRSAHDRAVEVGDRRIVGTALVGLATVARTHGDDERCVALLVGATDEALGGGDPTDAVAAAGILAEMLVARGAVEEAAVVLGAGDLVEDEVEVRVDFGLAPDLGPVRATVADKLGEHEVDRLGRDGRVIGLPAAVRRAGERLFDDPSDDPSDGAAAEAGTRPRTEARRR